jgi:hypothetical protein
MVTRFFFCTSGPPSVGASPLPASLPSWSLRPPSSGPSGPSSPPGYPHRLVGSPSRSAFGLFASLGSVTPFASLRCAPGFRAQAFSVETPVQVRQFEPQSPKQALTGLTATDGPLRAPPCRGPQKGLAVGNGKPFGLVFYFFCPFCRGCFQALRACPRLPARSGPASCRPVPCWSAWSFAKKNVMFPFLSCPV